MLSPRFLLAAFVATNLLAVGAYSAGTPPPAPSARPAEGDEWFEKRVRPLLATKCYSCHGERVQQAGLRLDTAAGVRKGADSGPVITAGDAEHSSLIGAVRYTGPVKMPPAGKLRPEEIATLEEWVRKGAAWPEAGRTKAQDRGSNPTGAVHPGEHWAFRPVVRPRVPAVKHSAWVKNPIDAFILAELEKHGLAPAPPADRRTLIRRASFDLLGLPPTPEETEAFVRDRSPDAWAKVIDRLLASPHYGERWGRHWLDVVRYADTAGETADYPVREAYRYRNYVIDAFNHDKPYNEFLREQLAGDLLAKDGPPERYAERVTATGYLAISRRFGFDPQNYQHLTIEDTIDTLGKSMLGLTIGCARCHDHKFDPVPTADYYGLYGIFASTRYAFPGSEEVKRPRDFVPLVPPAEAERRTRARDAELAALNHDQAALEAERASLRHRVGIDGDFELQRTGSVPLTPWVNGPNSPAQVRESAQSPFVNAYAPGTRGLAFANAGGYSGFGQPVLPRTPATTRYLYYNVDFRNTSMAAGGSGSWRYYLGHGPGPSAAVELFVNGDALFARNGDVVERVGAVRMGQWYNLQLVLDLQQKSYSGSFGVPGDLLRFSGKQFAPRWDGVVDYFFVDSYGHIGGVRPGHDVDNFAVRDTPIPPATREFAGTVALVADRAALRTDMQKLEDRARALETRRAALTEHEPYDLAYGVAEGAPADARIQRRGEPANLGDTVRRHFPAVLGGQQLPSGSTGSGRLELANWIVDPKNPLTARVIVNRVWQHHFVRGLVRTPNDFGRRGAPPTHPELLDWLASSFVAGAGESLRPLTLSPSFGRGGTRPSHEHVTRAMGAPPQVGGVGAPGLGWSLKALHRLIMLSNAYQMSSDVGGQEPGAGGRRDPHLKLPIAGYRFAISHDPENRWLSHQNSYRLEAEAIRDAMLFVSGDLDPEMGGPHPFPAVSTWGFTQHAPFTAVYESRKRSIYLMQQRIRKHPFFALFDGAEPNTSTPERSASTTPLQALFMMNDPFAHAEARKLAERLLASPGEEGQRVDRAYRLCFGRPAMPAEVREAHDYLTTLRAAHRRAGTPEPELDRAAWSSFTRSLLSANEFLFVD